MYYTAPEGDHELAGFMFLTSSRLERGPQIGGPLTVWHYHVWAKPRCVDDAGNSAGFVQANEECETGFFAHHRSYEMIHVWLIDRPRGPFSTGMVVGPEEMSLALEKRKRERGF